jgi:hypothetical protein
MLRSLHLLVFALVVAVGLASGAHALSSKTALRANFESASDRVGAFASQARETRQESRAFATAIASECSHAARGASEVAGDVAKEIGILRDAARGRGNHGLGSATADRAVAVGEAWVGPGARLASDGKTLLSADGLRQFRPPSWKPRQNMTQANFERRLVPEGLWSGNGHLDIELGPIAP